MTLLERAATAFDAAIALSGQECDGLSAQLTSARDDLAQPMRVAIVGRVKAGKSTTMNALLGETIAPTGSDELTFNVNWFVHAPRPGLVVYFKDDRPPEPHPLSWLPTVVDRTAGDPNVLRAIRHVEVGLPREILHRLQLIDTPGFGSFFDDDSRNTLDFLGLSPDELDAVTVGHARSADALLYLFSRGLAASDREVVEDFQGAALGDVTPVNAVAVLTKVDAYWDADEPDNDPLSVATAITRRLADDPAVGRIFFDVVPFCGLAAAGAAALTPAELNVIADLAALPRDLLARRLRYASRFATASYDDVPVPATGRAAVLARLGQWGTWLACDLMRSEDLTDNKLRERLQVASGFPRLWDLLLGHFGQRATLIKTAGAVSRSRAACATVACRGGPGATKAAAAAGPLEAFEVGETAMEQLDLLRRVYRDDGRLGLTPGELTQVLTVTGEFGSSCSARLGVTPCCTPPEMLELATGRLEQWRRRADGFGLDNQTLHAARAVQRSYEAVLHHLREAQRHLEMDA